MVIGISVALLLWAGVLAWGVVRNQEQLDIRKPLMIVGIVVVFLGSWAGLLFAKKNRDR